jgi:hypothetical protein
MIPGQLLPGNQDGLKAASPKPRDSARIEYFPILPCMVFGDLHRGLSGHQSRT